MVQLTYPGVYVQEVSSGARTITGVSTSIAAFVGMAKSGPLNEPTLVLGFRDYVRTFSDDISQGEMTDQVRQFFLNGGSQAYIVRVADGAESASVNLATGNGAVTLRLSAISAGELGDNLRATVDYNTANPESTFNLTVFRERTDASGNVTVVETESFGDLTMDPDGVRNVVRVLGNTSLLVRAEVDGPAEMPTNDSFSISAIAQSSEVNLQTFVLNAFPEAGQGVRRFTVRVGGVTEVVSANRSDLGPAANVFENLGNLINDTLGLDANTVQVEALELLADAFVMKFTATVAGSPVDIALDRAPASDVSVDLGLGVNQGGIERGIYSDVRPLPSGFVSTPGDDSLNLLAALGGTLKATWLAPDGDAANPALQLDGANPVTVLGQHISFEAAGGNLLAGSVTAGSSLRNLGENMDSLAAAFNSRSTAWRASRVGYRFVLRRTSGSASSGAVHEWAETDTDLNAFRNLFVPNESAPSGFSFVGGDDGEKPELTHYREAFEHLDQNVDIFNLLILPKSKDDEVDPGDRVNFWGEASAFARDRRAFLLIDPPNEVDTVIEAQNAVVDLRVGVVLDHAAFYWPRLRVNPDSQPREIDPSGTVAGIMARIDGSRGVWKAPAGLEADLRAIRGVEVPMSDPENGLLNPRAVNAIRAFNNGIVVWGARTMAGFDNSGNDDYKYVPVRRLSLFLQESLLRGLKFAVFEPNDEPLWAQIRLAAGAFMNNLFRRGAFQGQSARDAYFVKCDAETTTQNDINLGIVNVVVGFAPLKPAEFVVITIQQMAGQVQV